MLMTAGDHQVSDSRGRKGAAFKATLLPPGSEHRGCVAAVHTSGGGGTGAGSHSSSSSAGQAGGGDPSKVFLVIYPHKFEVVSRSGSPKGSQSAHSPPPLAEREWDPTG